MGADEDFAGGGDRVAFDLPALPPGRVNITARLLYQAVPPHWVDDLRASQAPEALRFVELYDGAAPASEVLGVATASLPLR